MALFFRLFLVVWVSGRGTEGVAGSVEALVLHGKTVGEWLKQLRGENRGLQIRAARVLGEAPHEMRSDIVPLLIPVLRSKRENDRFVAAQVLGEYGPLSVQAVPDLLPLLTAMQYERNRAAAAKALGQILKDASPSPEVDRVTTALIGAFKDPCQDVRREAAIACGMIGPASKACIPYLVSLLKEPPGADPNEISIAAAWVCERMGPLAREHVDLLIALMHRYASYKTPAYVKALGAIGPIHDNIIPNILDKMEASDQSIAWQMAPYEVFEKFGPHAAPAVDLLDRFLREGRLTPPQVIQTLKALRAIGPAATNALKTVERFTQINSYVQRYGRAATAEELQAMRSHAKQAVEAIRK